MRRPAWCCRSTTCWQDKDDYIPAALDYDTWDGKLWGIPYRIETHGVIYNKGKFKAAGLDPDKPPQTWPELVDAAKKLTERRASTASPSPAAASSATPCSARCPSSG